MRTATAKKAAGMLAALVLITVGGVTALTRDARAAGTPWLGVYTQALSSELREAIGYDGDGVLVSGVVPDSPADRAGLEKGDVITRVEGSEVNAPDELIEVIRGASVGDRVSIRYVRDGQTRVLEARLVERGDGENQKGDEDTFEVPTPPPVPEVGAPRVRIHKEIRKDSKDEESNGDENGNDNENGEDYEFKGLKDLKDLKDLKGLEGMDHLMAPGFRGRLGVRVESVENDARGGARVVDVVKDSPAEKAGIEEGDIITRVDDQRVTGDNLAEVIRGADKNVSLTIYRNGSRRSVDVELEDAPRPGRSGETTWKMGPGEPGMMMWKNGDGDVQVRRFNQGSKDDAAALRQEIRELRRQLEDLKRELEDMKRDRN